LDSVTAVLIHADSTDFTSGSMDCVLSTLSTILPKTLADNIAFVFTNVSTPSFQGFSVPEVFKGAPTFVFSNAIARCLHRLYRSTNNLAQDELGDGTRRFGRVAEQSALAILAKLFNWMGSLNPQPATEIAYLFEKYQHINNILTQMDQATAKKAQIDKLMTRLKGNSAVRLSPCSHLAFESYAR